MTDTTDPETTSVATWEDLDQDHQMYMCIPNFTSPIDGEAGNIYEPNTDPVDTELNPVGDAMDIDAGGSGGDGMAWKIRKLRKIVKNIIVDTGAGAGVADGDEFPRLCEDCFRRLEIGPTLRRPQWQGSDPQPRRYHRD